MLETPTERLDLGLRQIPQQSLQRRRVDVELLRSNCGVQRPGEGLPRASSGIRRRAASALTAASSRAVAQRGNGPRSACTISCASVQRSSTPLNLMSSRISLLDHRHIPRAGITAKSTDHPAGTSPHGS